MTEEAADVLIIGAGAAGAALAWSLAETRMRIVCLEQGDWMNPADYPTTRSDWETERFGTFGLSPNSRGRREDYPINDDDSPIKVSNFNAVGGSTILYAAHFPRMHPSDFRVRTLDGVADDWPLAYSTLEPYYDQNAQMMGVAGLAGDPAYPPKQPTLPPVPLGKLGDTMARGFEKLGWHWWPSDSAIATLEHAGRAACVNLGPCIMGCAAGAKGSTDLTYWPVAVREGVELRTRCRVREISIDGNGMADGAIYLDADGVEHKQRAEIVIVACNGVGTPRLLLNSRSPRFPDGLANDSGLVGKNFMFHPYAMVTGIFEERLEGWKGPVGCNLISQEFYETDLSRGFVRGYTIEMTRGMGPLSTAFFGMSSGCLPWGAGHHEAYARIWDRTAGMVIICEDLPEEHNQVTLDPERVDGDGIPAPKISYRLSQNSRRMLDHAVARGAEALEAAGAVDTLSEAPLPPAGWHLMGTARMGNDPERSVVNSWCRSHDVKNLFVVDGSVFVTSGGVNPTNTIQALALYVADTIKKNLTNLFE